MALMFKICFWLQFFHASATTCLPDAIPQDQRQNITMQQVQMPLGITTGDWDSGILLAELYGILVSEVLGYNIVQNRDPSTTYQLHSISGCSGTGDMDLCSWPPTIHVAMELWDTSVEADDWTRVSEQLGEAAPEIAGSYGFPGYDGMFVMERASRRSAAATGMHLSYYGNYNASWFDPASYAATVADVDLSRLGTCATKLNSGYPSSGQKYLDATGDVDGVENINGVNLVKCWQDKWFVAPSCRADPMRCIAVVTSGDGWGIREMMHKAFFYNMPVAFGTAITSADYQQINSQLQSLFYTFSPDATFALYNPTAIQFPENSEAEFSKGNYRTMKAAQTLMQGFSRGLDIAADRAHGLLVNFKLSGSDIQDLLVRYAQTRGPSGSGDYFAASCGWAIANRQLWENSWIPQATTCSSGRGLVDLQQNFVVSKSDAVQCGTCTPGRASVKSVDTRICSKCTSGSYQNSFGAVECNSCVLGSYAAQEGSTECTLCGLGEYASETGMTSCYKCAADAAQLDMWTTSQEVSTDTGSRILEVLGAVSDSFCACGAGLFLWQGKCEVCSKGTSCPGGNRLELLPGYFSSREAPGEVYKCRYDYFCPGGVPGTCAAGRDATTIACELCKDGLRDAEDGTCEACQDGDYAVFALIASVVLAAVTGLYIGLRIENKSSKSGSLIVVSTSFTQLVTLVQMLSVLRRFNIDWREPFYSILVFIEVLSFDLEMLSVSCLATMSSAAVFTFRSLLMPCLMLIALLVHLCFLLVTRSKNFRASDLWRTIGSMFLIFFIILFSMLLAPFQCSAHPSGQATLKRYGAVFCDGQGEHLQILLVGGVACLMPLLFLAICTWVVVVELPLRLARSDARFVENCSFLIIRFRPGAEIASVLLLLRNAVVALCPLVTTTSGQLLMMSLILYVNFFFVAFLKPWHSMLCNVLDCILVAGVLVILDMGSISVEDSDPDATLLTVMVFLIIMILAILVTLCLGSFKYIQQKYRKKFRFFLCHQKNAAGAMARLLKMELETQLPGTKSFIDCDDLNDLTRLFSYVGQDTDTFLVLGSPAILTRKWCVGEMVTAQQNNVNTILLTWPDFTKPDETFIENYTSLVPDVNELAKYGISLSAVHDAFRWLCTVNTQSLPRAINPNTIADVVGSLTPQRMTRKSTSEFSTDCPVLADPKDAEAVATAMVLTNFLKPKLLTTNLPPPSLLLEGSKVPQETCVSLLICSGNCFKSPQVQSWLLEASQLPDCGLIPVIAEDNFLVPSPVMYAELRQEIAMDEEVFEHYCRVIKAIFQEIAVVFVPQNYSSTHEDLQLRASQAAMRLQAGLRPLSQKLEGLQTRSYKALEKASVVHTNAPEEDSEEAYDEKGGRSGFVQSDTSSTPRSSNLIREMF